MEAKNRKLKVGALLSLLLLVALLIGILVLQSSTEPRVVYASENKEADANQVPADANQQPEQKQKDPNEREVPRPDHNHPAFAERSKERERMIAQQIQGFGRDIRDSNVLASLRTVPRHAFVRPGDLRRAYADHPLPIGLGQTISQPYIVAYMTEALKLGADYKVLEIGTGSGYQAAVCAEIAREVYTIEIIEELAESAKERLRKLGYMNVSVKAADGYFGWAEYGPFDTIIVTCAAGFVPPPLIEQLKPDGRMILPLGSPFGAQTLVLVTKDDKGRVRSRSLLPVRFVPMLGRISKK
ncbi:Protein-L-isoaspartate O-methyltransferase [subsurface metagenome]